MVGGRDACLTVQAAADGVIDFRAADVRDASWWRYTRLLVRANARRHDLAAALATLLHDAALTANGSLSDDSFRAVRQRAHAALLEVLGLAWPWANLDPEEARRRDEQAATAAYRAEVGDPRDPAFAARVRADYERGRRHRAAARRRQEAERAAEAKRAEAEWHWQRERGKRQGGRP